MKRENKDLNYYEWYIGNGKWLYGKDVSRYLMPKYRKARGLYFALLSELNQFVPSGNLVNDYLDLRELLSIINCQIEVFEEREKEDY